MAFSTFRGMMAAAGVSVTPPALSDIYTPTLPAIVWDYIGAAQNSNVFSAYATTTGNAGNYAIAYVSDVGSGTVYFDLVKCGTSHNSYATTKNVNSNSQYSVLSGVGGNYQVVCDTVQGTTNKFLVLCFDSSMNVDGYYLSLSGTTVSTTNSNVSLFTIASPTYFTVKSLPTAYAIAMCIGTGSTTGTVMIWDFVGGTTKSSQNLTSANFNPTNTVNIVPLTTTLSFACYQDATAGHLFVTGIDYASGGTGITWNTPTDTGITLSTSSDPMSFFINSTTVGLIYFKSSSLSTMYFRTATVGSGGSVTLNTEYSVSLTVPAFASSSGFLLQPYAPVSYNNGYVTAYMGSDAQIHSLQFNIAVNVFTFASSFNSFNIGNSGARNITYSTQGQFISVSNSSIGMLYYTFAGNRFNFFASAINVDQGSSNWTVVNNLDNAITAISYQASVSPAYCWNVGGNNVLYMGVFNGGTSSNLWTQSVGNNPNVSGKYYGVTGLRATTAWTANPLTFATFCNQAYDTTDVQNVILGVATTGNADNFYLAVLKTGPFGGAPVIDNATTINVTGIATNNAALIQLGTTSALIVCGPASGTYADNFVAFVVNTSGNNFGTIGSAQNLTSYNTAVTTSAYSGSLSLQPISSTEVLMTYYTETVSGSTFNIMGVVLSISGTTVTMNTPVTLASGLTSIVNNVFADGAVFSGGTTGMFIFNQTGSSPTYYGYGFTLSGTTITLGTLNTFTNGETIFNGTSSYFNYIRPVNTTQAVVAVPSSPGTSMSLITYNNVNSLTQTDNESPFTGSTTITYMLPSDTPNNYVGAFDQNGTFSMIPRG